MKRAMVRCLDLDLGLENNRLNRFIRGLIRNVKLKMEQRNEPLDRGIDTTDREIELGHLNALIA